MKIWYQTDTAYRYDEVWEPYGRTIEEQCKRVLRPDTEVYVTGVPLCTREQGQFRLATHFHRTQVLGIMLKAQKAGYDVFCSGSTIDIGIDEGREILSIPAIGIFQANLQMAALLGERFAIVTSAYHLLERYRRLINAYGFQSKYLGGNYVLPAESSEVSQALKDPNPLAIKYKELAKRAVADGASVIIPVPAYVSQLFFRTGGLTELNGATVLDPVAVVAKTAEMLVDLKKIGITFSRSPGVYATMSEEVLKRTLETYAKVPVIDY